MMGTITLGDSKFATTFVGAYLVPLLVALSAVAVITIITGVYKISIHLRNQDALLANIKAEVHPNGGGSLRDSINRIEFEQAAAKVEAAEVARKLKKHLKKAAVNQLVFDQMQRDWPFKAA